MRTRLAILAAGCLALAVMAWAGPVQAGAAYEKSGKYDDYPTFEGEIVTVNVDAGRLGLRGDDGFRTFSATPKMLEPLEKGSPVRVTYEQDGSGRRAVRIVPLVIPEGATPEEDIAAAKEKLIEAGILPPEEGAESR